MQRILNCLLVAVFSLPLVVAAQSSPNLELPDDADIRIIVDISGSMKANDPDNLRQPAVRLLARMLPEGASAGVWTFGQYVNMLVPHAGVTDGWRQQAIERSDQINSVALRTNLGEALSVASDRYLSGSDELGNTDFILLSDGKVDISDDAGANDAERERILGPLLEELDNRGATIHTVALSDEADQALLERLAAETGGSYSLAPSAEALTRAFLKALNTAVPQQQIPIDGDGFSVDAGVDEFTALIFRADEQPSDTRELGLISPEGEEATADSVPDGMRWVRETEYDLITVSDPAAGQWRIDGELGEGSRVTVVSDLRMVVSPVPPMFTEDEPVELRVAFFEDDQKIDNTDFLGVIDVRLTLTSGDGRSGTKTLSGDEPPADGVYTDDISRLPDEGEYELDVVADGQTFSRRFSAVTRFTVPEGEEASVAPEPVETIPEPEPESEPGPDVAGQPATDDPGLIDTSQVEEPDTAPVAEEPSADDAEEGQQEPAPDTAESGGIPVWAMAAAGGFGLVAVAGAVFVAIRRKKTGADNGEEDEPPVIAPEEQVDEEPEPEDELPEDEIPVADTEVDESEPEPEPEEESAETPEPEREAEPESEKAEPEEDDDEEFGLEDFDLSEFDDLPDTENDKGLLDKDDEPDDGKKK
ncbi:vWA domain-containing protein [Marinobacter sp. HL-58]|uniref:VWA domain-containing protein n=1 Tax=Marinobacter sp. HL-58 TaxID=1479237 RepID=UPI000488A012|nr:vWA domain-containing protein [Marinobacter sp. HL-58]KPQ01396.1 MAG: von Willebrand factor type A domain [Marinobacter sp. HL-58]